MTTHFEVAMGAMKMKIARDDIAEVLCAARARRDSPVKAARARGISVSLENEGQNAPSEINVIGYNVDDATREVEKFVDRAFLAGLPRVRVVHGSGMGILRKALRQALQQHPHVESVAEPPQNEGGGGATVVELTGVTVCASTTYFIENKLLICIYSFIQLGDNRHDG